MPPKPPSSHQKIGAQRGLHTRVKTARGRTKASTKWLSRQLNDPYVQLAKKEGYRSRAAYKLIELLEDRPFLKTGMRVVDLGAAPGGWAQVAAKVVKVGTPKGGRVVAVDILPMPAIADCTVLTLDFLTDEAPAMIIQAIGGQADAVLSDMAPSFTGHAVTDHLRTMLLVEAAYELACQLLTPGGTFVAKIIQGSDEQKLVQQVKKRFAKTAYVKPPASRAESAERYLVALGFKG
jgi:23S rRNA (uridine2552-2'-O)-methyltransferase